MSPAKKLNGDTLSQYETARSNTFNLYLKIIKRCGYAIVVAENKMMEKKTRPETHNMYNL